MPIRIRFRSLCAVNYDDIIHYTESNLDWMHLCVAWNDDDDEFPLGFIMWYIEHSISNAYTTTEKLWTNSESHTTSTTNMNGAARAAAPAVFHSFCFWSKIRIPFSKTIYVLSHHNSASSHWCDAEKSSNVMVRVGDHYCQNLLAATFRRTLSPYLPFSVCAIFDILRHTIDA